MIRRGSLKEKKIKPANSLIIRKLLRQIRSRDHALRLIADERAIEEKQSLLRHGRDESSSIGRVWAGIIKRAEQPGEVVSIDVAIHRSSGRKRWLDDRHGPAPHRLVERSGHEEQRVAHRFEVETLAVLLPEKSVLRVLCQAIRSVETLLLISVGKEH